MDYHIRFGGEVDPEWVDWFDGLTVALDENGDTVLTGLVDQAALFALFRKLRAVGRPLVSVTRAGPAQADARDLLEFRDLCS